MIERFPNRDMKAMIALFRENLPGARPVSETELAAVYRTENISMVVQPDVLGGVSVTMVGKLAVWRVVQFQTGTLKSANTPAPTGASRCPSNAIATTKRTCSLSSTF